MPRRLPRLHDWEADFREPLVLNRLSRGVEVAVPYHLNRQVCENCLLLPPHHTRLHVPRFRPHRLPPLVGIVGVDMSSSKSTYCEVQLF